MVDIPIHCRPITPRCRCVYRTTLSIEDSLRVLAVDLLLGIFPVFDIELPLSRRQPRSKHVEVRGLVLYEMLQ